MPIKSLESHLFEKGFVGSYPIEALKNATIGIDVNHYLSRLLSSKREQYLDAIGGFPTSFKIYFESDLKIFKEYKITPIFVFNGTSISNQLETSLSIAASSNGNSSSASQIAKTNEESVLSQRSRGWTQWQNLMKGSTQTYIDKPIQPQEPFRYNSNIESSRFKSELISYFIEKNMSYQVAPYCSWIQLSYLLNSGFIDAIYGPTDCLLLSKVDKFIIGMEFPNKEFRFIERLKLLKEFDCTQEEFIDIAMAVGNDLQPTTLPPLQNFPSAQLFDVALDMVFASGTNFYAYLLSNSLDKNTAKYVEMYQKGYSALKYMPIMKDTGEVELFVGENIHGNDRNRSESGVELADKSKNKQNNKIIQNPIPESVYDFISQQLPHEYYFYQSIGLIGEKLFETIATGIYSEEPPLDGGASDSYRNLVKKSIDVFKNKEIGLLTQPINRYYQIKPIKQLFWYDTNNPVDIVNKSSPSTFETINRIIIKTDDLEAEFSIKTFIEILHASDDFASDFIADSVIFPANIPTGKKLITTFDLLATSFLRMLTLLGFFEFDLTKRIFAPTKWGSVFLTLNTLNLAADQYERMVNLLLFLKLDVLKLSEDLRPSVISALSAATIRSYPTEASQITILSRLLTLFQIEQKPANYHGPIDKQCLAVREHFNFINKNLKELFESVIVSSLATGEFDRVSLDNNAWKKRIVGKLPFRNGTPNTIMAMMWEFFLQKYLHNGNIKADALSSVSTEFSTYRTTPNLEEQFQKSHKFLNQASTMLNKLAELNLIKKNDTKFIQDAIKFSSQAISA